LAIFNRTLEAAAKTCATIKLKTPETAGPRWCTQDVTICSLPPWSMSRRRHRAHVLKASYRCYARDAAGPCKYKYVSVRWVLILTVFELATFQYGVRPQLVPWPTPIKQNSDSRCGTELLLPRGQPCRRLHTLLWRRQHTCAMLQIG
jgi:hypothetical protein